MGFRDQIKSGGGFLNDVDATITGYEFTNKDVKGVESEWIYFVPSIKQDGAEDEVTQHFFMGGADRYEVSKDGQTVTDTDGGPVSISAKMPFGLLLTSMLDNGLDEDGLPDLSEDGAELTLEALVDRRYRFIQVKDEKATKELGKRKDKKTKKEYDRTNTVVSKVYDADEAPSKGKKAAAGKSKGKEKDNDLTDEADDILNGIIKEGKGSVPAAKLSMILTKKLIKNDNRDALRKLILSDKFQAREEGWTVNSDDETLDAA